MKLVTNTTTHGTIKMKPANIKPYIDCGVEHSHKSPKFKVGNHVRISKYKKYFCKGLHSKTV